MCSRDWVPACGGGEGKLKLCSRTVCGSSPLCMAVVHDLLLSSCFLSRKKKKESEEKMNVSVSERWRERGRMCKRKHFRLTILKMDHGLQ